MASIIRSAALAVVFYSGLMAFSPSPKAAESKTIRVPQSNTQMRREESTSSESDDDDEEPIIYTV